MRLSKPGYIILIVGVVAGFFAWYVTFVVYAFEWPLGQCGRANWGGEDHLVEDPRDTWECRADAWAGFVAGIGAAIAFILPAYLSAVIMSIDSGQIRGRKLTPLVIAGIGGIVMMGVLVHALNKLFAV